MATDSLAQCTSHISFTLQTSPFEDIHNLLTECFENDSNKPLMTVTASPQVRMSPMNPVPGFHTGGSHPTWNT